jgi:hypothetical protein
MLADALQNHNTRLFYKNNIKHIPASGPLPVSVPGLRRWLVQLKVRQDTHEGYFKSLY